MDYLHREHITHSISTVNFGFFSPDETRRLSVKQITNPTTLDRLKTPNAGGLYDPALGPVDLVGRCATCSLNPHDCPGHMGHIELAMPVYQNMLFGDLYKLLRATCHECFKFKMPQAVLDDFTERLRHLNEGDIVGASILGADRDELSVRDYSNDKPDKKIPRSGVKFAQKTQTLHDAWKREVLWFFSQTFRKCSHCHSTARNLTRDGFTRLLQQPLSKRTVASARFKKHMAKPKHAVRDATTSGNDSDESDDAPLKKAARAKRSAASATSEVDSEDSDADEMDVDDDEETMGDGISTVGGASSAGDAVDGDKIDEDPRFVHPVLARDWVSKLFVKERKTCELIYGSGSPETAGQRKSRRLVADPDMFFVSVLPVPPSRFRPPVVMGDSTMEHPHNHFLGEIIKQNIALLGAIKEEDADGSDSDDDDKVDDAAKEKGASMARDESDPQDKKAGLHMKNFFEAWQNLQIAVNTLADSTKAPKATDAKGIRQELEKKEGLLRMNMMGKRVNFACRSVISPDPYIATDEIGIPMVFATKLTYPEPVTTWNAAHLRKLVENGPETHPGANWVIDDRGHKVDLSKKSEQQRTALAKTLLLTDNLGRGVKVGRHLVSGDVVLVNRQPTLHRPGIMGHKAKVMSSQKTIRMHYANCNTYNADFDGDEMNVHFPQDELGRAEGYNLANTDSCYISPCNAKPLRGLIQDHVIGGVTLCQVDSFLTRAEYQQLVFNACQAMELGKGGHVITLPPTILKPKRLWTGKQVVSTVLMNLFRNHKPLSLKMMPKVKGDAWKQHREEGEVLFSDNELMTGVLDKAAFGASDGGLVHAVHQTYGPGMAGKLLTTLGRLFTAFLQVRGFTCGVQDLIITDEADVNRSKCLERADPVALLSASKFAEVAKDDDTVDSLREKSSTSKITKVVRAALQHKLRDPDAQKSLDGRVKQGLSAVTSAAIDACLPQGQVVDFPENTMALMTTTGAKGSKVNHTQICCLLGQQELEGQRVPLMSNGKSLPCFVPFDTAARAGGFIANRFLTGIRPQEYYFHCMAGREGLVDTAVKTSRSGYLQRCLMKHLESLRVHYDLSVRDDSDGSVVQFAYGEDALDVTMTSGLRWFGLLARNPDAIGELTHFESTKQIMSGKAMRTARRERRASKSDPDAPLPEPILARFSPNKYLGAVSETFQKDLENYIKKDPEGLLKRGNAIVEKGDAAGEIAHRSMTAEDFKMLAYTMFARAVVNPGEAVGAVAAQSIGEPSTQMTLNTFHSAGQGGNVTLGIPRLREIVMTASRTPKTPSMTLSIKKSFIDANSGSGRAAARAIVSRLERVCVADFVHSTRVEEKVVPGYAGGFDRQYVVIIDVSDYKTKAQEHAGLTKEAVAEALKESFPDTLLALIDAETKKAARRAKSAGGASAAAAKDATARRGAGTVAGDDDGETSVGGALTEDGATDGGMTDTGSMGTRSTKVASTGKSKKPIELVDEEDDGDGEGAAKSGSKEVRGYEDDGAASGAGSDQDMDSEDEADAPSVTSRAKSAVGQQLRHRFSCKVDREKRLSKESKLCVEWRVPLDQKKIMILPIAETAAKAVLVKSTPGIKRTFVMEPANKSSQDYTVSTDGVNFGALAKLSDAVEVNDVRSSHIYGILEQYGVEACANAIKEQVGAVFGAYGIVVDPRHLSLVADTMTYTGGYKPFNRQAMNINSSPWLKMSFETTSNFLSDAALYSDRDPLTSPSAAIAMGQNVSMGTGSFELRYDTVHTPPAPVGETTA